ncbi:MAG: NUDIX domain-containing protein [Anaerolineales bacterium]
MPASEQGVTHDRYTLIPRTLIFLTREDRVLLIKGAPHKRLWANRYNGIGGHIERGEDVLSAAQRELREETGLSSPDLRLCGTVTIDTGQHIGVGLFVLTGTCLEGVPVQSPEGVSEWVPVSGLGSLLLVEDLHTLLPRVLAVQPNDPPFAAHYRYDDEDRLVITFG